MTKPGSHGAAGDPVLALVNRLADLERRIQALEGRNGRSISIGTNIRLQQVGTDGAALLQAVRTADNLTVQLLP